jgi:hypothetical protein
MAKRYHQRQSEEQLDDGYEWGSHRGGGGAPLRNSDGRPISKLGTVINGNTKIDQDKYNGTGGVSASASTISIREIARPSTSYHAPTHNTAKLFDPSPPANISPIRQTRGHSPKVQSGHSNTTEVIAHNRQKSNRLRVTNLVQEQQLQHQAHQMKQQHQQEQIHHTQQQRHHLSQHQHDDAEHHLPHPRIEKVAADHTHSPFSEPNVEMMISTQQQQAGELVKEMKQLQMLTAKQTLLQSVRWGLENLDLIEDCNCIGNRGGEEVNQKPLTVILKEILIDFMKGRSHNIGIRKLLHYKNEHNKRGQSQTEDKFHAVVSEGLHLLCGAEPSISRRADGDCEVFIGVANYYAVPPQAAVGADN